MTTVDTTRTTGLEEVVSLVTEKMLPEINRETETIISQWLDTSMNEDSRISSNPSPTTVSELSVLNEVICFDTFESPSCLSDLQCINSVQDDLAMHVPQLVKKKSLKVN